ncbi:MAG: hypothetical protein WKG07_41755 [Hymenobacter sp.]
MVFVGELTLDGRLRAVPGVLPMTMAAKAPRHDLHGGARATGGGSRAGPGHGRDRRCARCGRWWRTSRGDGDPDGATGRAAGEHVPAVLARRASGSSDLDMADVLGMADARYATRGGGRPAVTT